MVDHLGRHARRIVECNDLNELPEGIAAWMVQLTVGAMPKSAAAEAALQIGRWIQENCDHLQHERESARRGGKGIRPAFGKFFALNTNKPVAPDDQRWSGGSTHHAVAIHSCSTGKF